MPSPAIKPTGFCALILAGGRGTRFWPRSRKNAAKQVLPILGERSMLELTLERLRPLLASPEDIWILTNRELRPQVLRQAPQVPSSQVIAEPLGRNTAPAIGLGAELILRARGDVNMGVFPSDAVIANNDAFVNLVRTGVKEAQKPGKLVVLGIVPTRPETGYGYIEVVHDPRSKAQALRVRRFTEKPNAAQAKEFVEAGHYYWNAGIFIWRASSILEAMAEFLPATSEILRRIAEAPRSKLAAVLDRWYPECENISIDYAVMERSRNIICVPAPNLGWNDLGSWGAVYDQLAPNGGTVAQAGPVVELDSANNFVQVEGKTVAIVGISDLVVVETPDALLIVPRAKSQKVGKLVQKLEAEGRTRLL
ncbi:MAG TPA: mannose-1-phosphate guanylyltransferase [Terriglobales bacterium]|nr:mannose-1-phosphate guanylyltransferase [Terriglobales bacterium]